MVVGFIFFITFIIPMICGVLAWRSHSAKAFFIGALAFVVAQVLIRLPLLGWLSYHSDTYMLWRNTMPFVFSIILGLSAALMESCARLIGLKGLKAVTKQQAIFFGLGHGGVEALLIVGVPMLLQPALWDSITVVAGVERIFVMVLHVGLTLLVWLTVQTKKWRYFMMAITLHTTVDASIGIVNTLWPHYAILILETLLIVVSITTLYYGNKKGNEWHEI